MIVSDGYSIEYYPKNNKIEIIMPQTITTIANTTAMVSNRRTDITELELTAILAVVKTMFERGEKTMTDVEMQKRKAICEIAGINDIGDLSDGFHTFNSLYEQRMMLFATIVKQNKNKAWKSLRHEDGELCFGGGWFIVGIDTPEGSYTYHYEDKYFSLFDCVELERGKHWDGHTEKDVTRLLSLPPAEPVRMKGKWVKAERRGWITYSDAYAECSYCHGEPTFMGWTMNFCPNCGADMRGGQDDDNGTD